MDSESHAEAVHFEDSMAHALALFDEAEAGKEITIERNGALFRLSPVRKTRRRPRKPSANDALWDIVGIGPSIGPNDVSANKHNCLGDRGRTVEQLAATLLTSPSPRGRGLGSVAPLAFWPPCPSVIPRRRLWNPRPHAMLPATAGQPYTQHRDGRPSTVYRSRCPSSARALVIDDRERCPEG